MRTRLDADELTHALDRDPELANAQGWASERGRYPGLVEDRVSACYAVLPWAFTQHVVRAFDAGAKELEFVIDVCLQATGRASPSSTPYKWLIVSWVERPGFQAERRTADDDIAARGFAAHIGTHAEARLPRGPQKPADAL